MLARRQDVLDDPFLCFLMFEHNLDTNDVEASTRPGQWLIRGPCQGKARGCCHLDHELPLCAGPMNHTLTYLDPRRGLDGRFSSPYKTWREFRFRLFHKSHRKVRN